MKIEMTPQLHPRRGGPVEIGNVYSNPHGKNFYKVVLNVLKRENDRPWNNIVMMHISTSGEIVGCSVQPYLYVSEHQDLVGKVVCMPALKIKWLTKDKS